MQLVNATRMQAAYTMGMKPDGRQLLVVVVKGTYDFPTWAGVDATLSDDQEQLVMADEFSGEPGLSSPLRESEFCPFKPRCDVVLNGSAHAPGGRPVRKVQVGLRVGDMTKSFEVVGHRKWHIGLLGAGSGDAEPFVEMPISYDHAFGGMDHSHEDPKRHAAFMENPVGRGYHVNHSPAALEGKPLPNTEETGHAVTKPDGRYRPMAFGPVGRGWTPRLRYAGTYDQSWLDQVFPFLPADFEDRHYQCAPEDQQIEYPRGGEDVVLVNLTPEGRTAFRLPVQEMPVNFLRTNGGAELRMAVVDTIHIDANGRRFGMVWRTALPLRRNMLEISQVVVGSMTRGWLRARDMGKAWYPSLEALVVDAKRERDGSPGRRIEMEVKK